MGESHSSKESPSIRLWIVSLGFWSGLGGAAALLSVLILAPRWLEVEQAQATYARNAQLILDLQRENTHLDRMADALEHDPDYRSRVAAHELRWKVSGELKIPSDYPQPGMQARVAEVPQLAPFARRTSPLIELLGSSVPVRRRCLIAAGFLGVLMLLCCHENLLKSGARKASRGLSRLLGSRYLVSSDPCGSAHDSGRC